MRPFIILLLLEAGICALVLLRRWEQARAGAAWVGWALALGLLGVGSAAGLVLGLSPRWFTGWYFVVGVMVLIIGYLIHALMVRRDRERAFNPGGRPSLLSELVWQSNTLAVVAVVVLLCTHLAAWFNAQYAVRPAQLPIPTVVLGVGMALGVFSGGLALAAALRGALCTAGLQGDPDLPVNHRAQAEALASARVALLLALYLRFVAILLGLWIWARHDAGAMRRFFELGVDGTPLFSMMRLFLGILLPAFTIGTIGIATSAGEVRVARWYFTLTLIFLLLGEVMGMAMTAGLRGIPF